MGDQPRGEVRRLQRHGARKVRQPAGRRVFPEEPHGVVLRQLHVWLVERIDPEHPGGRRRRDLPAQELAAEVVRVDEAERDHGVPRARQRPDGAVVAWSETEVDEDAILPVGRRTPERLAVDGDDPGALLARRLGDQLLHPGAERCHPLGRDERELVPPGPGERAEHGAEMQARVLTGGDRRPAGEPHAPGAVEKAGEVDAEEGGRHQPDVGQRRVAAADVGRVQEDSPEPPLAGLLLQRGAGVRDGHEVLARPVALRRAHPLPEEPEERVRLGGRARLGRDQVERARRIAPRRGAADRGRVGGVEHRDVRRAACDAEGPAEHLGGERRAAHAADERALEAVAARLGGERLQLGDARLHPLDQREPPEAVRDLRLVLGVVRCQSRAPTRAVSISRTAASTRPAARPSATPPRSLTSTASRRAATVASSAS